MLLTLGVFDAFMQRVSEHAGSTPLLVVFTNKRTHHKPYALSRYFPGKSFSVEFGHQYFLL